MPAISPGFDLRSSFYEKLVGKFALYSLLEKGLDDVRSGKVKPLEEAFTEIERKLLRGKDETRCCTLI